MGTQEASWRSSALVPTRAPPSLSSGLGGQGGAALPPPPSPGPENAPGSPAGPGVLGTRSTSPFPGGDGTKLRQGPGQGSGLRARPGARLPPLGAPGRGRRACSGQNSGTLRPRPRRLPLETGSFAPGRGPWGSGCKPPPPQSTVLPGLGRLLHFLSTDTRPRPSTAWIRGAPPPQPTDAPPPSPGRKPLAQAACARGLRAELARICPGGFTPAQREGGTCVQVGRDDRASRPGCQAPTGRGVRVWASGRGCRAERVPPARPPPPRPQCPATRRRQAGQQGRHCPAGASCPLRQVWPRQHGNGSGRVRRV